jgi:dienelactone hydrolase
VSLGAHEVEDLEVLVAHVRNNFPSSMIGLWGRSMGAVTALLYSQRDPSIAGVVRHPPMQHASIKSSSSGPLLHACCVLDSAAPFFRALKKLKQWLLLASSSAFCVLDSAAPLFCASGKLKVGPLCAHCAFCVLASAAPSCGAS